MHGIDINFVEHLNCIAELKIENVQPNGSKSSAQVADDGSIEALRDMVN